jgi:zinc transport system substrate-binding protein
MLKKQKKLPNTIPKNQKINDLSYDMHIWLSPPIAIESAIAIHDMLINIMPKKKYLIDQNLKQFKKKMMLIEKKIKNTMHSIKEKKYFVFHNAYQYFEKYYKIYPLRTLINLPGFQTGAKELYEIKKNLQKYQASCIFIEPQFNTNIINIIIRGTNIHTCVLDPLGTSIPLSQDSYIKFLFQLSNQYIRCLNKN